MTEWVGCLESLMYRGNVLSKCMQSYCTHSLLLTKNVYYGGYIN